MKMEARLSDFVEVVLGLVLAAMSGGFHNAVHLWRVNSSIELKMIPRDPTNFEPQKK